MDAILKPTILIADDAEINRDVLNNMLHLHFNIIEAKDGAEAINILTKYGNKISLVLLDIIMPNLDGYGVLAQMKAANWLDNIPVVIISSESDRMAVAHAYELGAADYIARPFDSVLVLQRVVKTINYYRQQRQLVQVVANELYAHERNDLVLLRVLMHAVEVRNGEDAIHLARVGMITELLLKQLVRYSGDYKISSDEINIIKAASALHDIGKLGISEHILKKNERLTPDEEEQLKQHTTIGADILRSIPDYRDEPLIVAAEQICRWHHEKWDGSGYPDGLKNELIPIAAQVVSMADTYDVMVSRRMNKKIFTHDETMHMIIDGECGVFNPDLLSCFRMIADKLPEKLKTADAVSIEAKDVMRRVMIQALHKF